MAVIAIYDSGVGGLSIYQHVVRKCPDHDYLFVCDNQAFPYGTKPAEDLLHRTMTLIEALDQRVKLDVLIVACNTASTLVLPDLRDQFDFQVIGVVPAIKPAAEASKTKKIAILATPATVERRYTNDLIASFAADCEVLCFGSSELVQMAEEKLLGTPVCSAKLQTILESIINDKSVDVMVLACTHFPLLKPEIQALLEKNKRAVLIVDSGEAIANRLKFIEQHYRLDVSSSPSKTAMLTDLQAGVNYNKCFESIGFEETQHLNL